MTATITSCCFFSLSDKKATGLWSHKLFFSAATCHAVQSNFLVFSLCSKCVHTLNKLIFYCSGRGKRGIKRENGKTRLTRWKKKRSTCLDKRSAFILFGGRGPSICKLSKKEYKNANLFLSPQRNKHHSLKQMPESINFFTSRFSVLFDDILQDLERVP